MKTKIAYCGLDCGECDAYKATVNDDTELRMKLAKVWSANSGMEIDPADINCSGCKSDGVQIGHCAECYIRHCAIKKSIDNCAHCVDYTCDTLDSFLKKLPSKAKDNLEAERIKITS